MNKGVSRRTKENLLRELEELKEKHSELQKQADDSAKARQRRRKEQADMKSKLKETIERYKDLSIKAKDEEESQKASELMKKKHELLINMLNSQVNRLQKEAEDLEKLEEQLRNDNDLLKTEAKGIALGQQIKVEDLTEKSLNFLTMKNPIRLKCVKLATNEWFDYIILMIVAVNVFFLILDDPLAPSTDNLQKVIYGTDIVLVSIFLAEMFLKIIALGLLFDKNTYLRYGWNVLDFVINAVSVIGLFPDVARLSAFRTLRVLRALRAISKLKGLQTLVNALLSALVSIANIGLLILFLYTIFSIFAVQLWGGLYSQQCFQNATLIDNSSNYTSSNSSQNTGLVPVNSFHLCSVTSDGRQCPSEQVCLKSGINPGNGFICFDNFAYALLTLFVAMSRNRWSFIMYYAQDVWSVWAWVYFVIFVIFCTMFAVNLIIALIVSNFHQASLKRREQDNREKRTNRLVDLILLAADTKDEVENVQQKRNNSSPRDSDFESDEDSLDIDLLEEANKASSNGGLKKKQKILQLQEEGCWKEVKNISKQLVNNKKFEFFILSLIVLNLVILALRYYGMSNEYQNGLEITNYVLTVCFVIEVILKWIGLGVMEYFSVTLNRFDFVVVIVGIIEIIISFVSNSSTGLIVLRAFRLIRLLKFVSRMDALKNLLVIVRRSLPSILYLTLLLFVFVLIYALAGRQLLAGKFISSSMTLRYNYDTFWWSCVTTFKVMTGDDWATLMYYAMNLNEAFVLYYVSLYVLGSYIMLSLFVGVLFSKLLMSSSKDKHEDNIVDTFVGASSMTKGSTGSTNEASQPPPVVAQPKPMFSMTLGAAAALKSNVSAEKSKDIQQLQGKSLFIFGPQNPLRIEIARVLESRYFEVFIVFVVVLNCLALTLEYRGMPDLLVEILSKADYVFTSVYLLEMILKIFVYGFVGHKGAYLRVGWNVPDFIVTILSVIGLAFPSVRSIQGLRALRILRLISKFKGTKIAVMSIVKTIPSICYVTFLVLFLYLIFAIVGVNFFGGQFWSCTDTSISTRSQCVGYFNTSDGQVVARTWNNPPYNFDNVGSALLSLFQVASLSGWSDVMYAAVDVNGVDNQPQRDNHPENAIFFIVFIIVGSFFSLNLYTAVIIHNFLKEKKESGSSLVSSQEIERRLVLRIQQAATPRDRLIAPDNPVSLFFFKIVDSKAFDVFISTCIFLNTIALAIPYYGMPDNLNRSLDYANYFFLGIFTLEALSKIIGYGPAYYFGPTPWKFTWNKFDFLLVIGSLALVVAVPGQNLLNVIRVLRVARILRLVRKLAALHKIFMTFVVSLPSLRNILSFIFIIYFIYAVIGVKLLGDVTHCTERPPSLWYSDETGINTWANFESFPNALLSLLRVSTLDTWFELMVSSFDCWKQSCPEDPSTVLFYVSFIFFQSYVILNLFLAVLVENFTDFLPGQSSLEVVPLKEYNHFRNLWTALDPKGTGFIPAKHIIKLLKDLGLPLGFDNFTKQQVIDELELLDLHLTPSDQIQFEELLWCITKRATGMDLKELKHPRSTAKEQLRFDTLASSFYQTQLVLLKQKKQEGESAWTLYVEENKDKYRDFFELEDSQSFESESSIISILESSSSSLLPSSSTDSRESSAGSLFDRTPSSSSSSSDSSQSSKGKGRSPRQPSSARTRRRSSSDVTAVELESMADFRSARTKPLPSTATPSPRLPTRQATRTKSTNAEASSRLMKKDDEDSDALWKDRKSSSSE